MKKKYMVIIAVIGVLILAVGSIFFYKSFSTNKAIKKGIDLTSEKEYNKALAYFDLALDNIPNNKEALEAKGMIETYLDAKELFDADKMEEANGKINEISDNYSNYTGLNEDIDILKNQINESIKKDAEISDNINKVRELVKSNNYDEAKKEIDELENENLNQAQKQQVEDQKSIINSELARVESEKKAQEQAQNLEKQKQVESTITAEKATELVRNYLISNSKYVAPIIEVDSEDDIQYTVHCYEKLADHTATSGWYYVNKKTGSVKSMM